VSEVPLARYRVEEWRPVPGYEGLYEVSDGGLVFSVPRIVGRARTGPKSAGGNILTPQANPRDGRLFVHLCRAGRQRRWHVHRLVGLAFLGPLPAGLETRHLDGNHLNNHVSNLAYGTTGENHLDAVRHGTAPMGVNHHRARLTEDQVRDIRARHAAGVAQVVLIAEYGLAQSTVNNIVLRKSWKHLL
jgi:hypothetical protein